MTFTNTHTYDAASNRTTFTAPDGTTNTYQYDSLNRLTGLTNSWAGNFGFSYDQLSRRTQMTRPNPVNTSYQYDSVSRLLSVLHKIGSSTIDGATYTHDNAGNRISNLNHVNSVTENYTYDLIYQLTQVVQGGSTTESYTYDQVGNRLSSLGVSPYSHNSSNQLSSTPQATFTYDSNGNTLTKVNSNGTTAYSWDFENRLNSVALPGGAGVVTFKYDPFGRRIQKSSPAGVTTYAYDGENIAAEYDTGGALVAKYAQGAGIDEPLAMWRSGAVSYHHADGLGSITSMTDNSGSAVAAYTTDAFGMSLASAGTVANPFRYTGREWDQETGLYYYRARYYDPQTGRFISEDPIGFADGPNFYRYVENEPLGSIDPSGLARCIYSITAKTLTCTPDNPKNKPVVIPVSSGNNGEGMKCKDNPKCTPKPNRGPIPQGEWEWTDGYTSKRDGRVLKARPGTETYDRDLFRTHSCANPFGAAKGPRFCSEGCITGLPKDIRRLNKLLDAEPGSTLRVTD